MRKILLTTIAVVLFFIAKPVFGAVVINEALYNATGVDTGKEYIVLYNNGDSAVDLTGYELNAVSGDYYVFPSFSLNAKSFVNIYWRKDGTNSSTDLYTGTSGFDANMGDTSGWIALFKNNQQTKDTIVDYIEYGAGGKTFESKAVDAGIWTAGNFITNAQEGKAIKLQVAGTDNNLPSDWVESTPTIISEEPSPTEQTPTTPATSESGSSPVNKPPTANAGDNIIGFVNQEVKFDGIKSSDPESSELHYEWNIGNGKLMEGPSPSYIYAFPGTYLVTLTVFDSKNYASDTITVKIEQAQITINEFLPNPTGSDEEEEWIEVYNDSDFITNISGWQLDDSASSSKAFTFPENTLIAPKSYLVFSRQITKITLNNDQDSVKLLLPGGVLFQEVKYEKPPQGKSSARTKEGFVWSDPTPGLPNISGTIGSNPSTGSGQAKQTVSQLDIVEPQITKNSTKTYAIDLPKNNIEGGYIAENPNVKTQISKNDNSGSTTNELASIEQGTQKPVNLVFIIIAIIFGVGFLGLLLVKSKRKSLPSQ